MLGYVDLHCHFVAQIDDGCRNIEESAALLEGLYSIGFSHVVATPHMRPGLFDNEHSQLRAAYRANLSALAEQAATATRPTTSLGSEHFFDALVIEAIHDGRGLPYSTLPQDLHDDKRHGGAILIEFHDLSPLPIIEAQLFRLLTAGFLPVIAHPERYREVWARPELVAHLQNAGCVALLDAAALVGKYGQRAQGCARTLLKDGVYHAACSDAHRPSDVPLVEAAMKWISREYGKDEVELLFRTGPSRLLLGERPESL